MALQKYVKETSLNRKEADKNRNIKFTKGKNLIGKGKYTLKVVDQPLIKLVGRLKNKICKIIYIHNKCLRNIQQKDVKPDVININCEGGVKNTGLLECVQT